MLLNLAFERDGFCIRFIHDTCKRARQHTGLAGRVDRNGRCAGAGGAFDRLGQFGDRPGQRARNKQRQRGRAQHRDRSDEDSGVPQRRGRRHHDRVGYAFDDGNPFGAGQNGRRKCRSARSSGLIRYDIRDALPGPRRRCQIREIGFPVGRVAELGAEFTRTIGMDEVVAPLVDDVDFLTRPRRRTDAVEGLAHIDVDHENAERFCRRRRRPASRHAASADGSPR